ncbi:MAG TPA: class I SAM-dependent methyltransferase [Terriglobia bacterium]|nr:class I SAM-dependent methyltransferase [Terriglobia bacterium]
MSPVCERQIESVQEFWDGRPCNIRHSSKCIGTREYFDEVEARKYFVEPHIPGFANFEHWRGRRVLEIGCGIGTDTINFARHGAWVTAVDLSGKSLALARQRAATFGMQDRIHFYEGNAEELRKHVPCDTYDLVYSFGVLHHTPRPDRVLGELRSYTRPGSILKLMVYHRHSWKVLWILMNYGKGRFWRLDKLVADHSEAQTGCPVTLTYSRRSARAWVERHGFHATEVRVEHIFPYQISDYVRYRYRKVWYFGWVPQPAFRWLEHRFGWHVCLTAERR